MIVWILSALGWLRNAAESLFSLATRYPLHAALIASLCLSFWLWLGKEAAQGQRDRVKTEYAAFQQAVIEKTAEALTQAKLNKARVETAQAQVIKEIEYVYVQDRDTNRAAVLERMRAEGTQGGSGSTGLSVISDMPGGSLQGSGAAVISQADALICSDNFTQLTALIAAWKGVAAVE